MWSLRIYTRNWNSFWNKSPNGPETWEGFTSEPARAIARAVSEYIDESGDEGIADRTWVYDISRTDVLPELDTLKIKSDPTLVFFFTTPSGASIAAAKLIGRQINYPNVKKIFYYIRRMSWNQDGNTLYSPDFGTIGASSSQMQAGGSVISFNPWNVEEKIDFGKATLLDNLMGILVGALVVWGISENQKKAS